MGWNGGGPSIGDPNDNNRAYVRRVSRPWQFLGGDSLRRLFRDGADLSRALGANLLGIVLDACLLSLFLVHLRTDQQGFARSLNHI